MPLFEIEQYQIHSVTYRVIADSPADAIVRLLDCEAKPVDGSLEFIEIAESVGLDVDECDDLGNELRKLGFQWANTSFRQSDQSLSSLNDQRTPTTWTNRKGDKKMFGRFDLNWNAETREKPYLH